MPRPKNTVRNKQVAEAYASTKYTTEQIAEAFGMSRRRVQQIVKEAGIIRTQAEANRIAAPLKRKHRLHTKPRT